MSNKRFEDTQEKRYIFLNNNVHIYLVIKKDDRIFQAYPLNKKQTISLSRDWG